MKKLLFYLMMAEVILITACNKEDGKETEIVSNQMTMTTTLPNVSIFMTVHGKVDIDWGDKTEIESFTFQSDTSLYFTHAYSTFYDHNITITGDNISYLICNDNLLTQLDVSRNPALRALVCSNNQLTSLDLSKNDLQYLNFSRNKLTSLDMSNKNRLRYLDCSYNLLSSEALNTMFGTLHNYSLGITKELYIGNNPGTNDCDISIAMNKGWVVDTVIINLIYNGTITIDWGDISENYTIINIIYHAISHSYSASTARTITISGNGITSINCTNQGILQLDVSKCPNLTRLHCGWNKLTSLDVSRNTSLISFDCYMNELKDLDISKNTELEYLNCHTNQLTNLDLRNNITLRHLLFSYNQLTSEAIDATFETLNNTIEVGIPKLLYFYGNPGTYNCDRSIAENKGWSIMDVP